MNRLRTITVRCPEGSIVDYLRWVSWWQEVEVLISEEQRTAPALYAYDLGSVPARSAAGALVIAVANAAADMLEANRDKIAPVVRMRIDAARFMLDNYQRRTSLIEVGKVGARPMPESSSQVLKIRLGVFEALEAAYNAGSAS
jgi:hypothetical protein